MNGRIQAQDLHRMAYNAAIYANRSSTAKGHTLWIRGGSVFRVVTTDDFFILVDHMDTLEYSESSQVLITPGDLKAMEGLLRGVTGEVDIAEFMPENVEHYNMRTHLWASDEFVWRVSDAPALLREPFAIAPDRLRKLSLIKPGDFPIDFIQNTPDAMHFKCGPTVRGAVGLLDRDTLMKLYTKEELWM